MANTAFSFEPGVRISAEQVPLCVPEIRGNEWKYVKECLDTGWVSSVGEFVNRFERETAAALGAAHGVSTVNGTSALHIALLVAGVEPDDEVLVSTLTFIAPVNAIRYAQACPVFIDAEPRYWQMDPEKVAHFLERECIWREGELRNRTTGRRVKAILPVHILGHPVDIDAILQLARKFELAIVEDATESLGSRYKNRAVGVLGDIACLSFNGNKLITTGGGGMIATNREDWASRAKYLTTQAKDDPIEYVHGAVGYNYRLTNIAAAIGCAQLELLPQYIEIKRNNAARYADGLRSVHGVMTMPEADHAYSTYWLYTILIDEQEYGVSSRQLLRKLADQNIQARPLWQPIHLSPVYAGMHCLNSHVAEKLNRDALSLPSSVGLRADELDRVLEAIA
jgi:perosamine synthetase